MYLVAKVIPDDLVSGRINNDDVIYTGRTCPRSKTDGLILTRRYFPTTVLNAVDFESQIVALPSQLDGMPGVRERHIVDGGLLQKSPGGIGPDVNAGIACISAETYRRIGMGVFVEKYG